MTDARVFVAGATGYTGRAVVEACARRGAVTVAHVRPDSPRRAEWTRYFADVGAAVDDAPWERGALAATLGRLRPTHVFILVGTTRRRARRAAAEGRAESYATVDLALPLRLVAAAADAAAAVGVRPRLVYLSAVGAREDTRNGYLRVRGLVERALRESGLPWLAARPSFITGGDRDEGRPLERLTAAAVDVLLQPLRLAGPGARRVRDRYRSTSGPALGQALARVAFAERGPGRVVTGEELR